MISASSPNTGSMTLTVNLQDYNEYTPSCTPTTTVASPLENITNPSDVAEIFCSDADTTASLAYSISAVSFLLQNMQITVKITIKHIHFK